MINVDRFAGHLTQRKSQKSFRFRSLYAWGIFCGLSSIIFSQPTCDQQRLNVFLYIFIEPLEKQGTEIFDAVVT
jgi:hypothetical protein